jgi:DNA polymerase I-like protein with 3'-5' exonuclease and polymerase domains
MKTIINLSIPEPVHIKTEEQAGELCIKLKRAPLISIDTETTGLNIATDTVVFWSMAYSKHERFFLEANMLPYFAEVFTDKYRAWIGSQVKYDAHILANSGHPLSGDLLCTLTMDRLLDPRQLHGLKDVYSRLFGEYMKSFAHTFFPVGPDGKARRPPKKALYEILKDKFVEDPGAVINYASMDAWGALRVFYRLRHDLRARYTSHGYSLWHVFINFEVPMTRTLYEMEREGVRADVQYLQSRRPLIEEKQRAVEKEVIKQVGRPINLSSPKQLATYFFTEAGYDNIGKTATGQFKMNKEAYKALAAQGCETATLIADYAKLQKVLGTYVDGMLERVHRGKIHTNLNQHKVETSRLSSSDPNLQNAQKEASEFVDVRSVFIADDDESLIVDDYEQLEMYILGDYSQDKNLLSAIILNKDIHCANVETIYGDPYEESIVAKKKKEEKKPLDAREKLLTERRGDIKAVCFGIVYGKAARSLGIQLKYHIEAATQHPEWDAARCERWARQKAQEKIDLFFAGLPGAHRFIQTTIRQAYEQRFVETRLGRQRMLPDILDYETMLDHAAAAAKRGRELCWCDRCTASRKEERRAVNTKIQGCLPACTRVFTSKGLLPIGTIPERGLAWTGHRWAEYRRLSRGPHELATISLSTGQVLHCDTRHEVLVATDTGYVFQHWSTLRPGTRVCLSLAQGIDLPDTSTVAPTDAYWLGFLLGNGCTRHGATQQNAVSVTFGDRKHRHKKEEQAQKYIDFLCQLGLTHQKPRVYKHKIAITTQSVQFKDHLKNLGYPWGASSHEKSIPTAVWSASLNGRTQFLLGLLDADGCVTCARPNLHMCNKTLLEEVQILSRTVGVESRLHGPYHRHEHTSWRLDFNRAHLAALSYGHSNREIVRDRAPAFAVKKFIADVDGRVLERGSDQTLLSRMRRGGNVSVYTLNKLAKKYEVELELYATAEVVATVALGVVAETYTLSVSDESHRFDSEGVISKNTAADVCMLAMLGIQRDEHLRALRYKQLLQIHDEILGSCPRGVEEEAAGRVQWHMENCGLRLSVPLRAPAHWGKTWREAKG